MKAALSAQLNGLCLALFCQFNGFLAVGDKLFFKFRPLFFEIVRDHVLNKYGFILLENKNTGKVSLGKMKRLCRAWLFHYNEFMNKFITLFVFVFLAVWGTGLFVTFINGLSRRSE